jgi:hypothetical protein
MPGDRRKIGEHAGYRRGAQKAFDQDEIERIADQRRRAQPLQIENAQRNPLSLG